MKVWVLAVSNSDGCCRPDVFDSKAKAVAQLAKDFTEAVENAKAEEDEIEAKEINTEAGWAYIQCRDSHVDFNIYEEEVK